jgi:cyclopropane-fatty-acyl-phospholipid synthase
MEGLQETVQFELKDYREVSGCFDRIVSVGMFEHAHTIGRSGPRTATHPFIAKYIFPGGYIPALSETCIPSNAPTSSWPISKSCDCTMQRPCAPGASGFLANWDKVAAVRDENSVACGSFYLACSEVAFRYLGLVVLQVQVVKQIDVSPLTRDYMTDAEQRLPEQDVLNARVRLVGGNSG